MASAAAKPGPVFTAANRADASFDAQCPWSCQQNLAIINLAVIAIIDVDGPGAGAAWNYAKEKLNTNHGA